MAGLPTEPPAGLFAGSLAVLPAEYASNAARPSRTVSGMLTCSDATAEPTPVPCSAKYTRVAVGRARAMGWAFACRYAARAAGEPSQRSSPRSKRSTLSARGRTCSRRCSAMRIVTPRSLLMRVTTLRKSAAAIGSSCAVGSSRRRSFGFMAKTAARFKSCFWPPESS